MLPPKTRNGNHPACIGSGIISPGYLPRPLPSRAGSMNDYLAWFDGACEPVNPRGTASFGVVIKDNAGTVLVKEHGIAGKGSVMSNKLAEYSWSRVLPTWPETRVLGQAGAPLENGQRTASWEGEFVLAFGSGRVTM